MTIATRPLSASEKSILKMNTASAVSLEILKAALFGWLFFSAILFAILFSLWKWVGPQIGFDNAASHTLEFIILSATVTGVYLGITLWTSRTPATEAGGSAIARDLAAGVAAVEELNVTDAVEIAEYEDEGAGFLLGLEDGRVLCVIGQDLYEYAHDFEQEEGEDAPQGIFPSTRLTYAYAPQSGYRLGITGTGAPLKASRLVETKKSFFKKGKDGKRRYTGPEDGVFYPGTLDDVLRKFGW